MSVCVYVCVSVCCVSVCVLCLCVCVVSVCVCCVSACVSMCACVSVCMCEHSYDCVCLFFHTRAHINKLSKTTARTVECVVNAVWCKA